MAGAADGVCEAARKDARQLAAPRFAGGQPAAPAAAPGLAQAAAGAPLPVTSPPMSVMLVGHGSRSSSRTARRHLAVPALR
jgi:hypothetical protein